MTTHRDHAPRKLPQWWAACLLAVIVAPVSAQARPTLRLHFADGSPPSPLLRAIEAGMTRKLDFERRYTTSVVPCGTGCFSYWFVDLVTGTVLAAPESDLPGEVVSHLATRKGSSIADVWFSAAGGDMKRCIAQRFSLRAGKFVAVTRRQPAHCPQR